MSRRAFKVAPGPIVARAAFMLQCLFVSERPAPLARERVPPGLQPGRHEARLRRRETDGPIRRSARVASRPARIGLPAPRGRSLLRPGRGLCLRPLHARYIGAAVTATGKVSRTSPPDPSGPAAIAPGRGSDGRLVATGREARRTERSDGRTRRPRPTVRRVMSVGFRPAAGGAQPGGFDRPRGGTSDNCQYTFRTFLFPLFDPPSPGRMKGVRE